MPLAPAICLLAGAGSAALIERVAAFRTRKVAGGIVEGLSYRVKLRIKKAYGLRTLEAAEIALYYREQ